MKTLDQLEAFVRKDASDVIQSSPRLPEPLKNSHIYITGGTGFLGSWLLELIVLLNDEHEFKIKATVVGKSLERFSTTRPHLFKRKEFTFLEIDARNLSELPKDITHIIHAAALTNRNQFASYPTLVSEININSTMRIFRLAQQLGSLQNILLISSGLVYGNPPSTIDEIKEDSQCNSFSSFDSNHIYAESKRASESIASAFLSEAKLPVSVARPFAFVGPYQPLNLPWAVTDFVRDSLQGGPVKIMGDGSAVRSIMYGSDFANWILHLTAYASPRSVYNVGSSVGIDILSLAKLIGSHFNPEPKILTMVGNAPHQISKLVPSVSKIEKDLQLKITVDLKTAIERSIAWHKTIKGLK